MSLLPSYFSKPGGGSKLSQDGEDDHLVAKEGMGGEMEKCELRIEGMTCGACVEVCEFFCTLLCS